jgi:hypothetical protein
MHDFVTFATMAVTSLVSGAMLSHEGWGWHAINYGSLPFLLAVLVAIAWLSAMRRKGISGTAEG